MVKFSPYLWIVFGILLLLILFVGGTIPFFLFYVFLFTVTIPLIQNLWVLRHLKGKVVLPQATYYTGEHISINYQLENLSSYYLPYVGIESQIFKSLTGLQPSIEVIPLEPKSNYAKKEVVHLKKRGYYPLGDMQITVKDAFHLFTFTKIIKSQSSLTIYPKSIELDSFRINASQQQGELKVESLAFIDRTRIESLRPYVPGDLLKQIHWKVSAKKTDLISKNHEYRGDAEVSIFMNNDKRCFSKDMTRRLEDKMVDVALAIVHYCLHHQLTVSLYSQSQSNPYRISGSQQGELKPFLEAFAYFSGDGSYSIQQLLLHQIDYLQHRSSVMIVSPYLGIHEGALGIQLKNRHIQPVFIIVSDLQNGSGYCDTKVMAKLHEEGVTVLNIDFQDNIKSILEGTHEA